MPDATQKVGSAAFWIILAKSGRFALGLISSILVVRSLGETNYGVLSLMRTVLILVVSIGGMGLGQGILRFLPELRVREDARGVRRLVSRVVLIQSAAWLVLLGASYLLAGWFEGLFAISGVATLLVLTVALAIFELWFVLLTLILSAHYDTKLLGLANLALHTVFIAVLLVVLPRGWGVKGVLIAGAAGNMVASLIVMSRVGKLLSVANAKPGIGLARSRVIRFSLPFAVISVLNMIVWRQSETFFLAHYWGPEKTGFFDLAYRIPQMVLEFIPGTIWPLVMAGFSEAYTKNTANLRVAIHRYYKMLFLVSTPICVFGAVIASSFVSVVYGDVMEQSGFPMQLFFAIFTMSFFGSPLSMALYVLEKTHVNLLIYLGLAIVNIGLDVLLIPRWGLVGAMIPVAFVIVISPIVYKIVLSRYIDDVKIPIGFIVRCFFAASPVLLLIPFTDRINSVFGLIASLFLFGCSLPFMFKWLKVIGTEETQVLGSIPIPAVRRLVKFISA